MRILPILLLLAAPALGEGKVTVTVNSNQVAVNVPFAVNVEAQGQQVGNIKLPQQADGLDFQPQPVLYAEQKTTVGTRISTKRQCTYMATATHTGRVTVPPIGFQIDGKTVFSEPLELTVTPEAPHRRPTPPEDRPEPGRGLRLEQAVFATSEVDQAEVYEQEPVQLTLAVWKLDDEGIDVAPNRHEIEPPDTQGFYAVPRTPVPFSNDIENREGRRYRVARYRQILYPTRVGDLTVGEWRWEVNARFFHRFGGFQSRDIQLKAPAVVVHVKPLPQPCPPDFRGAVGRFEVKGELTEKRVPQGMPTRLVVRVTGQGNPDAIGDPALPALQGVHVDDPVRQDTPINDPQSISVERSFVYALTPTQPGTLRIPEIPYTYFDVAKKEYVSAKVGPFDLEVTPSREISQRVVVDASTPAENRVSGPDADLEPIVFDPGALWPRRGTEWGIAVVAVSPPLAFAALALFMARRRRFQNDVRYARSYHARSQAHRRLEPAAGPGSEDALYRAMAGYVADKFGVPGAGLTSADVARLLEANGVDGELREGYLKVLRACERVRYGRSELSPEEYRALTHAALSSIDRLEGELGGSSW